MPEPLGTVEMPLARSMAVRIDQICDRFEAAWKTVAPGGPGPQIEDYLGYTPEPERDVRSAASAAGSSCRSQRLLADGRPTTPTVLRTVRGGTRRRQLFLHTRNRACHRAPPVNGCTRKIPGLSYGTHAQL